jgi:putative membrane protein
MIVRPRPSLLELMFSLKGSIVPLIAPRLAAVAAVAVGVTALRAWRPGLLPEMPVTPFTLVGLALSIFLGFRNNACYDRWWEARKLWGQLLTDCRTLARETTALLPPDRRRAALRQTIAFTHALRARLRGLDTAEAIRPWLEAADVAGTVNPPDAILRAVTADFAEAGRAGLLNPIEFSILASRLAALGAIQAACERIMTTPTPYAYTLLLHRTAWLFCLLLPISLPGDAGPVFAVIVAYAFFGLDALGDQLEAPFALGANAIPLDALSRAVERELLEAMGETALPPPLTPVAGVLT